MPVSPAFYEHGWIFCILKHMAATYYIAPHLHLFYLVAYGKTTGMDYFDTLGQAVDDPAWHPDYNSVIDMRAITEHIVDLEELYTLVERDAAFIAEGTYGAFKNAYLVRNDMDKSIGKLYDLLLNGAAGDLDYESEVFYALEPALDWLGLAQAQPEIQAIAEQLVYELANKS